jgi:hypothetical protein
MQWKGPYVGGALPVDPWGKPYIVNYAPSGPIWVQSAGANLKVQTAVTDNEAKGDDIGSAYGRRMQPHRKAERAIAFAFFFSVRGEA